MKETRKRFYMIILFISSTFFMIVGIIKKIIKTIQLLFGWLFRLGTIELFVVLIVNLNKHTIDTKDTMILVFGMIICNIIGWG